MSENLLFNKTSDRNLLEILLICLTVFEFVATDLFPFAGMFCIYKCQSIFFCP